MVWNFDLSDKMLALYGFAGGLLSSIFLTPRRFVVAVTGGYLAAGALGMFLKSRWVESDPNEWLLIIRDGKLLKAGVGLKTFIGLTDSYVKFPSKVEQISFRANNVTKEMQGVEITGFAFWSVYREGDGPFRCYKYMEGGDANSNVTAMCESVLRNLIANSTLEEVLRHRNTLRDKIKAELKDQLKGWGIWLETVEITEVLISSDRLFHDLQAEFRHDANLKAQQIELSSKEEITKAKQDSEIRMSELKELNETKKQTTRNDQRIKRDQQQAEYDGKKNALDLEKMKRDSEFEITRMQSQLTIDEEKVKNNQEIERSKQDFDFEFSKRKLDLDKEHTDITLLKYQIDSTERIYNRLNVRDVRINQFSGGDKNTVAALLPHMGYAMGQLNAAQ